MKRPLVLLLVVGSLLALPLAQAQMNTSLVLTATAPETPLPAEGRLAIPGVATYTADVLVMGNLNGVPVTYTVSTAPAWATVVVSPQTDIFPVGMPALSPSQQVSRPFTVIVDGAPGGIDNAMGLIEITATATPSMQASKVATAKISFPVRYDAGEDACPEHDLQTAFAIIDASMPTPTETEREADASDDDTTTVQSGSATPLALPAAAVLGFAAVGAGVGLVLRRRRGP